MNASLLEAAKQNGDDAQDLPPLISTNGRSVAWGVVAYGLFSEFYWRHGPAAG
jgi:hypothetical protein